MGYSGVEWGLKLKRGEPRGTDDKSYITATENMGMTDMVSSVIHTVPPLSSCCIMEIARRKLQINELVCDERIASKSQLHEGEFLKRKVMADNMALSRVDKRSPENLEQRPLKRARVALACQRCRTRKQKVTPPSSSMFITNQSR